MSTWHGKYLTEDEIVEDLIVKIGSAPGAAKGWVEGGIGLWFTGMNIRNYYGLWHENNPYTKSNGDDLQIENGVITDPRFPDNYSGRIMDRVRVALGDFYK